MPKTREEIAEEFRKMQAEFAKLREDSTSLRNSLESFGEPGTPAGSAQTVQAPQAPQFDYQAQISQLLHGSSQQQQQQQQQQQLLVDQQQSMQQQSAFQQQWQWQMQQQRMLSDSSGGIQQQYHEVAFAAAARPRPKPQVQVEAEEIEEKGKAKGLAKGFRFQGKGQGKAQTVYDPNKRYTGRVRKIFLQKAYGHIECMETERLFGRDVFLHRSAIGYEADLIAQRVQFERIQPGDVVTFQVEFSQKMADVPRAKAVVFEKIEFEKWGKQAAAAQPEPEAKRPRLNAPMIARFSAPSVI